VRCSSDERVKSCDASFYKQSDCWQHPVCATLLEGLACLFGVSNGPDLTAADDVPLEGCCWCALFLLLPGEACWHHDPLGLL
jgi:hypothetical protein